MSARIYINITEHKDGIHLEFGRTYFGNTTPMEIKTAETQTKRLFKQYEQFMGTKASVEVANG